MRTKHLQNILLLLLALTVSIPLYAADRKTKKFVVVIDAGHGGHDPGAIGKISKEKNINLRVALKLGRLIENNCPDVKVVYTRKTDVFIALDRRAQIANNAKADLFISVHTNSLPKGKIAYGASTWTLGLAKSDANLDVAKRENSVILYESDYKTRYAGFNPNSSESYIIFEFMQDKYMSQSVQLAGMIQKQFQHHSGRQNRGVHQAGFLVLKASAMPSVLVELGFISTPAEEQYLNSENGSSSLANSIFRAFLQYKRTQELQLKGSSDTIRPEDLPAEKKEEKPAVQTAAPAEPVGQAEVVRQQEKPATQQPVAESKPRADKPVFCIQVLTSNKKIKTTDARLKGLKGVEVYAEKGTYKYTYGASNDYNQVYRAYKNEIRNKFPDSFIIAFKNGEKMDVNEAIREFKRNR